MMQFHQGGIPPLPTAYDYILNLNHWQFERISLANDICKKYRREGKFFDEIFDEAKGVF